MGNSAHGHGRDPSAQASLMGLADGSAPQHAESEERPAKIGSAPQHPESEERPAKMIRTGGTAGDSRAKRLAKDTTNDESSTKKLKTADEKTADAAPAKKLSKEEKQAEAAAKKQERLEKREQKAKQKEEKEEKRKAEKAEKEAQKAATKAERLPKGTAKPKAKSKGKQQSVDTAQRSLNFVRASAVQDPGPVPSDDTAPDGEQSEAPPATTEGQETPGIELLKVIKKEESESEEDVSVGEKGRQHSDGENGTDLA